MGLFDELAVAGFTVSPGQLTGLRNPRSEIDDFQDGLMKAVLGCRMDATLIRKTGIMGIVLKSGEERPGDVIRITLPAEPHKPLEPVSVRECGVPLCN